jgi:spermidine synthase
MPNDLAQNTSASVDVFELDPEVPRIVKDYFSLDPKILTTIGDARHILRASDRSYDVIFGDSFNSYLSVPWHLLTKEFNQEISHHLAKGGIYAVNIIATKTGEGSALYESVDKTLRETFPFVEAYAFGEKVGDVQNIVFLSSQAPLDRWIALGRDTRILSATPEVFEKRRVLTPPEKGMVLTDDHAPTDTMLLPIARRTLPASIQLYYGMTN